MSIEQQWERAKGPNHRRLRLVYEGICLSVEAHFNQGQPQRKYFVDEITMTSSAICNSYVSEKSRPKGKIKIAVWNVQGHFVVKFHDSTIEPHTSITCIITLSQYGSLSIDSVYYSDDGSPVEGLTKQSPQQQRGQQQ